MRNWLRFIIPLAFCLFLAGCKEEPPAELAGIRRVAVLALENGAACPEGVDPGRLVKDQLLAHLSRRFALEVIDGAPCEEELRNRTAPWDPAFLADLGRRNDVDGLVTGTITEYRERREGALGVLEWYDPEDRRVGVKIKLQVEVAFNLRLLRTADGASVFHRRAAGRAWRWITLDPKHPVFSMAMFLQPHFEELRVAAVRQAVDDLLRNVAREYGGG